MGDSPSSPEGGDVLFFHADVLIDRAALAACLPGAWADVLAYYVGGGAEQWKRAYQEVADDNASYWADLDLNSEDSLYLWREGRWRMVRAWFRLAGFKPPPKSQMALYLNDHIRQVGARCSTLKRGARGTLYALYQAGYSYVVLDPYLPANLLAGILEAASATEGLLNLVGPEELKQAGLDGITWAILVRRARMKAPRVRGFVSAQPFPGAPIIPPPDDLADLLALLTLHPR